MYNAPPTAPRHTAKVTSGSWTPRLRKLDTSPQEAGHLAGAWLALFCGFAAKILPVGAACGSVVAAGSGERQRERERERAAAEKAALLPNYKISGTTEPPRRRREPTREPLAR